MKKAIKFLSYFPQVPGRVWIDVWSLTALVRFALGKSVDSTAFLGVLGFFVVHKTAKMFKGNADEESSK